MCIGLTSDRTSTRCSEAIAARMPVRYAPNCHNYARHRRSPGPLSRSRSVTIRSDSFLNYPQDVGIVWCLRRVPVVEADHPSTRLVREMPGMYRSDMGRCYRCCIDCAPAERRLPPVRGYLLSHVPYRRSMLFLHSIDGKRIGSCSI